MSDQCGHPQCCLCLKRECQQSAYLPRFKRFAGLFVCGESCLSTAVHVAYEAARRLGTVEEKPCGRDQPNSAAILTDGVPR